jgi:HEAT repeat protein
MRKCLNTLTILTLVLTTGCGWSQKPKPQVGVKINPPPPRVNMPVDPNLRQSAQQHLQAGLADSNETIRAHAVEAIKESLGIEGRKEIMLAFHDAQPLVRFAAAMAAGELRLVEARPMLLSLLTDPDPHVQIGVIFALHRLGDTRYSTGLEKSLQSAIPEVRANTAFALGRLGERSALRILQPMTKDSAVEVRLQVAEAMWRLGDQEGLKYLVAASISQHPAQQMVGLLGLAGPRNPAVVEHVRSGLGSDYVEVALVAGRALGMLGADDAYALAVKTTKSDEPRQRYLAALALGAIGRADSQGALAAMLNDADKDVRVAAAAGILQLK